MLNNHQLMNGSSSLATFSACAVLSFANDDSFSATLKHVVKHSLTVRAWAGKARPAS